MRIKIKSDGTIYNTRIWDLDTGQEIAVTSLVYTSVKDPIPRALIEIAFPEIEVSECVAEIVSHETPQGDEVK